MPLQNSNNISNNPNSNNLLQYLNSAQRNASLRNQENSSSNQNDNFNINISQSLNNPRFISFGDINQNSTNNININNNQENEINTSNNINNNEPNDLFFNNNFESKITQAHNGILNLLNEERKKMKDSQETIEKLRVNYIKYKRKELEKLDKEKNELKYLFKFYNGVSENDILELNIGGTHEIATTRATLTKYKNSALAVFFSGQSPIPMIGQ